MKFKKYYIYLILIIIIICISLFILKKNKKELFTSDNTNSEIEVRYIQDGISHAIDITDDDVDLSQYDVHNSHIFPNNFRPNIQKILDSDDTKILDCEGTYEPCSTPCGNNRFQKSSNNDCPLKRCEYIPCKKDNQEHDDYCGFSEGTIEIGDCSVDCDYGIRAIINTPINTNCNNAEEYEYCFEKHCPIECDGSWSEDYLLKSKTQDFQNQDLSVVGNNSDLIRVKVWEGETEGKYGGNCNTLTDINGKFNYNNTWYRYQDYDQPQDCEGSWKDQCTKIDDNQNANIDSVFINANKWVGKTQGTYGGECNDFNDMDGKFTYNSDHYKKGSCLQPVDCQGEWGDCENGILNGNNSNFKTYNITRKEQNGGEDCPYSEGETKTEGCNQPVDCVLSNWSNWGNCSASCGGGTQTRTRTIITQPQHGGNPCNSQQENRSCNTQPCPVDCQLSQWGEWGDCSASCGGGTQTRTRTIITQPQHGGNPCNSQQENRSCNTQPCPVDCQLSQWGEWGDCSASCGGGTQTRTRTIITQPQHGGNSCGLLEDAQECIGDNCGPSVSGKDGKPDPVMNEYNLLFNHDDDYEITKLTISNENAINQVGIFGSNGGNYTDPNYDGPGGGGAHSDGSSSANGMGGSGKIYNIRDGTDRYYGGGGGGGGINLEENGGLGGGGNGGYSTETYPSESGNDGIDGTGGGGGGAFANSPHSSNNCNQHQGGRGGSGCVIIRTLIGNKSKIGGVPTYKNEYSFNGQNYISYTYEKINPNYNIGENMFHVNVDEDIPCDILLVGGGGGGGYGQCSNNDQEFSPNGPGGGGGGIIYQENVLFRRGEYNCCGGSGGYKIKVGLGGNENRNGTYSSIRPSGQNKYIVFKAEGGGGGGSNGYNSSNRNYCKNKYNSNSGFYSFDIGDYRDWDGLCGGSGGGGRRKNTSQENYSRGGYGYGGTIYNNANTRDYVTHSSNDFSNEYISYTYNNSGTFQSSTDITNVEILVVGGGGSGSEETASNSWEGAGGGAGTLVYFKNLTLKANMKYNITVGTGGGIDGLKENGDGSSSTFESDDSALGWRQIYIQCLGGGAGGLNTSNSGRLGGSGGGGRHYNGSGGNRRHLRDYIKINNIQLYNAPTGLSSISFDQSDSNMINQVGVFAHNGGRARVIGNKAGAGGGGGAGGTGGDGYVGHGGDGKKYNLEDGTVKYYAAGGGAGRWGSNGGSDIGGDGYVGTGNRAPDAGETNGAVQNTGSGGGGGSGNGNYRGGSGADGIVIIRYPVQ